MLIARQAIAVVLLAAGTLATTPARAWGPEGHAIIADIAAARLTPPAKAQIAQLLALEQHQSLGQVASWADDYRSEHRETAPWHFVDIPLDADRYDPARDCKADACVIAKTVEFTAVLAQSNEISQTRLEALKWVVHFVGDVHQPLHDEDHEDRGGNDVKFTYFGKPTNLHAIWDTGILEHATGLKEGPNFTFDHAAVARVAGQLDASITDVQRKAWASSGMARDLSPAVIAWAEDAHAEAQQIAYADLPDQRSGQWAVAYQAAAWPVVQTQIEMAGVRLAELLNEALK